MYKLKVEPLPRSGELPALFAYLKGCSAVKVVSVFSHLATEYQNIVLVKSRDMPRCPDAEDDGAGKDALEVNDDYSRGVFDEHADETAGAGILMHVDEC